MANIPPNTRGSRPSRQSNARTLGASARKAARAPAVAARDSRRGTLLAGLGIGLAVGAAIALVLAPRSGAETREALRNRGRRVRNSAGDAWEDLRLEMERTTRALRRKRRDARVAKEQPPSAD